MLIWWQRGISSHVRFAAWMPATCATVRTSPFLRLPALISSKVAGASRTRQRATASRTVSSLPPTSIMRALPLSSRCVSSLLPMLSSYTSHGAAVVAGRLRHALGFLLHRPHKQRAQCLLVDDGPQGGPDIDLVGAEQAQPQVAVGDQTQAVARGAEMLGDGRDDGDGSGCPGIRRYSCAGPLPRGLSAGSRGASASSLRRSSAAGTRQLSSPSGPMGMYSMKRTSIGRRLVRSTYGAKSSLTPRRTTTLSLMGLNPVSTAALSPARAVSSEPRRVRWA